MHKVIIPLGYRSDLVEAITDDVTPFAYAQDKPELNLIERKTNLQVCYVDTIHDITRQV